MKADWEGVEFNVKERYKTTDTYILRGTDEILALFDEHIMTTQTLQFSAYKKPFEEDIEDWSRTLLLVNAQKHTPQKKVERDRGERKDIPRKKKEESIYLGCVSISLFALSTLEALSPLSLDR